MAFAVAEVHEPVTTAAETATARGPGSNGPAVGRGLPWTTVLLTLVGGLIVSVVALLAIRSVESERLRIDFERRSGNLLSYIQFETSRRYVQNVDAQLQELAELVGESGSPDQVPLDRYTTSTRNVVWIPWLRSLDQLPGTAEERPRDDHPLLRDIPATWEVSESRQQDYFPIARVWEANERREGLLGLELGSHRTLGVVLRLAKEMRRSFIMGRYLIREEGATRGDVLYLFAKPVFATSDDQFLGFIGFMSMVSTEPFAGYVTLTLGGLDLLALDGLETEELRRAIAEVEPLVGGSRADRGTGRADVVTVPRQELLAAARTWRPWMAFAAGLLLTLLTAAYVRQSQRRTSEIERLVSERTEQLSAANRELEREIEERKRTELALRESEKSYRLLAENMTDVIWTFDRDWQNTYLSPSAKALRGFAIEEARKQPLHEILTPEGLDLVKKMVVADLAMAEEGQRPPSHRLELEMSHQDGSLRPVEVEMRMLVDEAGEISGYLGVTRDITQRKREEAERASLEAQLFQARKMEAIGALAGGIAHDFNNLLTGILGYSSLLQSKSLAGDAVHKASSVITRAAERGRDLTQQLLGFARQGKLENRPVDLDGVVDEVVTLLRRTTEPSTEVRLDPGARGCCTAGDPSQLQLMVLNLVVNARDAMPEGGTLSIATGVESLEEGDPRLPSEAAFGEYLRLSISDTGPGVLPEIRERIFEPFFTTKGRGEGTGMGLATVYGIVQNHGGFLRVESEVGEGATFEVYLPVCRADAQESEAEVDSPAPGVGRVLVVDDEPAVREVAVSILDSLGYDTVAVEDGARAVSYYREHGSRIDVVLLDWLMPGMDGAECFRALQKIDPEVRAILTTGFGRDGVVQELLDQGVRAFVQKPFRVQELAAVVASVLTPEPQATL